jgi:hypothetical protein
VAKETREIRRRNHTVTGSYLRRFADDTGLLTGVKLPGDHRFSVSVGDATVIKNFYVVQLPDGSESDQAEKDFGEVESDATAAISALIDGRAWPVSADARMRIAEWVALQYLRVPWIRQLAREIAGGLSEIGLPVTTGAGERIMSLMPADQVDRHGASAFHIEFIRREMPVATRMLYERDWILTSYQRRSLLTSDAPVVLRPMIRRPGGMTIGLGQAAEVQIPLDRRVALSMVPRSTGDRWRPGNTKSAGDLNQAVVSNARRYLFHHPSDDPLKRLALPHPRERELDGPEMAVGLVADLFDRNTLLTTITVTARLNTWPVTFASLAPQPDAASTGEFKPP